MKIERTKVCEVSVGRNTGLTTQHVIVRLEAGDGLVCGRPAALHSGRGGRARPIRRMATNRAGGLGVDVDETMLNELCAASGSRIGTDLTTLLDRTPPTASAMQPS